MRLWLRGQQPVVSSSVVDSNKAADDNVDASRSKNDAQTAVLPLPRALLQHSEACWRKSLAMIPSCDAMESKTAMGKDPSQRPVPLQPLASVDEGVSLNLPSATSRQNQLHLLCLRCDLAGLAEYSRSTPIGAATAEAMEEDTAGRTPLHLAALSQAPVSAALPFVRMLLKLNAPLGSAAWSILSATGLLDPRMSLLSVMDGPSELSTQMLCLAWHPEVRTVLVQRLRRLDAGDFMVHEVEAYKECFVLSTIQSLSTRQLWLRTEAWTVARRAAIQLDHGDSFDAPDLAPIWQAEKHHAALRIKFKASQSHLIGDSTSSQSTRLNAQWRSLEELKTAYRQIEALKRFRAKQVAVLRLSHASALRRSHRVGQAVACIQKLLQPKPGSTFATTSTSALGHQLARTQHQGDWMVAATALVDASLLFACCCRWRQIAAHVRWTCISAGTSTRRPLEPDGPHRTTQSTQEASYKTFQPSPNEPVAVKYALTRTAIGSAAQMPARPSEAAGGHNPSDEQKALFADRGCAALGAPAAFETVITVSSLLGPRFAAGGFRQMRAAAAFGDNIESPWDVRSTYVSILHPTTRETRRGNKTQSITEPTLAIDVSLYEAAQKCTLTLVESAPAISQLAQTFVLYFASQKAFYRQEALYTTVLWAIIVDAVLALAMIRAWSGMHADWESSEEVTQPASRSETAPPHNISNKPSTIRSLLTDTAHSTLQLQRLGHIPANCLSARENGPAGKISCIEPNSTLRLLFRTVLREFDASMCSPERLGSLLAADPPSSPVAICAADE
jgi:hypothetical protein